MNIQRSNCFKLILAASLGFSWFGLGASAATGKKGPAATTTSKSSEAVPVEAPKSVFNAIEGRNPFFPAASVQPLKSNSLATQPPPKPTPVAQLVLNGIVPPGAEKPTAMINGHTFEQGEAAEVKLPNGTKIQIKCEEIRMESAIISIDGVKSELKLRFGA